MSKEGEKSPLEDRPIIIAVEGRTEREFYSAFISKAYARFKEDIQVYDYKGANNIENFLESVDDAWKSVHKVLVVVTDADEKSDGNRDQIFANWDKKAQKLKLPNFTRIDASQKATVNGFPARFIIDIKPVSGKGAIETFLLGHVKSEDDKACAEKFLECIKGRKPSKTKAQADKTISEAVYLASIIRASAKESHGGFYASFANAFSSNSKKRNQSPWDFESLKEELEPFFDKVIALADLA